MQIFQYQYIVIIIICILQYTLQLLRAVSGVTTMASDRADPGAPKHNGPNGGPPCRLRL
jgi:hypothetical protein